MSTVNIAIAESKETTFIVADSAAYDLRRRVRGFIPKVRTVPHGNFVVACRGNLSGTRCVMKAIEACASMDEALDLLDLSTESHLF